MDTSWAYWGWCLLPLPHSAMSQWVRGAERSVMIDGCFLQCHGRVLRQLTAPQQVIHFDAFRLHRKYADVFSMDDVPEAQRRETAREVADAVLGELSKNESSELRPGA